MSMRQQPDDRTIADDDQLWRGLQSDQLIKQDGGGYRVASSAFKTDGYGEVSVNVDRLTTREKALSNAPSGHMAEVEAGLPRSFCFGDEPSQSVCYTVALYAENDNPGHAHIHSPDTITKSQRDKCAKKMALKARIVPPL